ncbi:MAG TPA: hypothetical protein VHX39_07935 [Acetobacteraceae bacterium]|jgi:GH15 family glucan-1,4-alpha-glucosidase|nr:hypothetical protein [Acetobacteraceae bacterium]
MRSSAGLVCTCWHTEARAQRREEALALFGNGLTHRNPLGLRPDDIAPDNGTLWGNLSQTWSRIGRIFAGTEGMWHAS